MKKILTIILAIMVAIAGASCIAVLVKKGDSGGGGGSTVPDDSTVIDPAECDHSVTEWILVYEPDCINDGKETLRCKKCKADLKDERPIPALGHDDGEWVVTITADCTTPGEKILKCTRCEAELNKELIPILGHDAEWVVDYAPKCDEFGREVLKCGRCEEELDEKEIPSLGHIWSDWNVYKPATCTEDGQKKRICTRISTDGVQCTGEHFETIPALGHIEVIDAAVAATCTTPGKTEGKHCSRCNTVITAQTDIPALGHVEVIDPAVEATQTVPGKTAGAHCSRCNEVLVAQEDVPFANGYTVTFTEDYTSGDVSPDVVVILTFTDSTKKYIARRECGEHKNVVSMQIQENSESVYLKYQMNGKEFIIYNKGSGNASDVVTLFGNVSITWYIYGQECILSDSLVTMADGTKKALGDIVVGDKVLSYDWDTMNLVENEVVYASGQDNSKSWTVNRYFVWTFSDGTIIKSAFAHRFYNLEKRKFVYLEFWEIGEHIYKEDGTYAALLSVETIYEECTFARITLKNGTNYFANGALTGDRHCPSDLVFGSLQSSEEVIE